MSESFDHKLIHRISRRPLEALTLVVIAIILWGGWVPFDVQLTRVQPLPALDQWSEAVRQAHWPDVLANIALYIPLGLLVRAALRRRGWGVVTSFAAALLLGLVLSGLVECVQAFSVRRMSSLVDWVANVAGAGLGALSFTTVRLFVRRVLGFRKRARRQWWEGVQRRPSALAAQLAAVGIALVSLAPFDVAVSVDRLLVSAKDTTVIPFARTTPEGAALADRSLDGQNIRPYSAREHWHLRLDYLWTLAAYALLGVLLCRYLARHCALVGVRLAATVVAAGVMLAVSIAGGQMLIMSRSADVTQLILAGVGALVGTLLADALLARWSPDALHGGPLAPTSRRGLVTVGIGLIAGYITARQLVPFDFDASREAVAVQLAAIETMPLAMYQAAQLPVAVEDLLHKLLRWASLAAVVCVYRRQRGMRDQDQPVARTMLAAGGIALGLEAVQILLPARNPAITDVLLAATSAGLGVVAYRFAAAALTLAGVLRPVEAERVVYNVELGASHDAPAAVPDRRPTRKRVRRSGRSSGRG
jgi:VanZ family protein